MKARAWRQLWLRCLPPSLFGRNLLLIVALILLAALLLGLVLRQQVQQPRLAHYQQFVLEQAASTLRLLRSMDAAQRHNWQVRSAPDAPRAPLAQAVAAPRTGQFRNAQQFTNEMQPRLGAHAALLWQASASDPRLWLQLRVDAHDYYQRLDTSALQTNLTPLIIVLLCASGLLALLGAVLISRRLNRPLQQLAQAAGLLGRGAPLILPASLQEAITPSEIGQVTRALQQLAHDLDGAENERAFMLAGVSHDVRTPLTKLRLACELLQQSALERDGAQGDLDLLDSMIANIASADGIIGQFVGYARSGGDEALDTVDLVPLLRELAGAMPQLRLALPDDGRAALPLQCRVQALQRALVNLLENAFAHAPPQQRGDILLRAQVVDGTMLLTVADRGPGIKAAQRQHVRQPFTRLEHVRGERGAPRPGLGLGLAIVERIARMHQGQLLLQDREGGGLAAVLSIPLVAQSSPRG